MSDHLAFVRVRLQSLEDTLAAIFLLLGKRKSTGSGTGKTGVEAERSDATALGVLEELEVVQDTVTEAEATKNIGPTTLGLVAVSELDVSVGKRIAGKCENGVKRRGTLT